MEAMEKIGAPINPERPADYRTLSLNCNNREQLVNFSQISRSFVSKPGGQVRFHSLRMLSVESIQPT